MKTISIARGVELFRGTAAKAQPDEILRPRSWFGSDVQRAETYAKLRAHKGSSPRVLVFKVMKRIPKVALYESGEIPSGESICKSGLEGLVVAGDAFLCSPERWLKLLDVIYL